MEPVICLLKVDLSGVSTVGWHRLPNYTKTGIPVEAHIAQSVEHFLGKEEVIGSNPIVSTISLPYLEGHWEVDMGECVSTPNITCR